MMTTANAHLNITAAGTAGRRAAASRSAPPVEPSPRAARFDLGPFSTYMILPTLCAHRCRRAGCGSLLIRPFQACFRMSATANDRRAASREVAAQDFLDGFCQQARELFERQAARANQLEADLVRQIETALAAIDADDQDATKCRANAAVDDRHLAALTRERDALLRKLDEARAQQAVAESSEFLESVELGTLREQFETAQEEIDQLKYRNEELDALVARLRSQGSETDQETSRAFDWEAQKRQLLQRLEADLDGEDSSSADDRLAVEDAIRVTDEALAAKEREIDDLRQRLAEQANTTPPTDGDPAAVEEILDQDELIREERARLQKLQDEWHEKLRQAEIDLSVERARLGREKNELQCQVRLLEQQTAESPTRAVTEAVEEDSPRSGWRTRFGLKND